MTEILEPGGVYHIFNHANGAENLFLEEENYRYFLEKYRTHVLPVAELYGWCLMPNHFHLMIGVKEFDESKNTIVPVSKRFSNLFNAYSKAFNKKYKRQGSLFQRPFKRKHVTNESYFYQLILYIHFNPVHHGFVEKFQDWPHSSWNAFLQTGKTLLSRSTAFEWFGGMDNFLKSHEDYVPGTLRSSLEI